MSSAFIVSDLISYCPPETEDLELRIIALGEWWHDAEYLS